MEIILGSASPRRQELLGYFSLPFRVIPSSFDERKVTYQRDPRAYVQELSEKKNVAIAAQALVITADTVVYLDGEIFNKPESAQEATETLGKLAGRWHSVFTAISIRQGERLESEVEETRVLFHPITPLQAHLYQQAIQSLDKAGGYAIQGAGHLIIEKIEGCYTNVIGFPLTTLQKLLRKFDIDLWNYLKN